MKVLKERIGNADVYIQTLDEQLVEIDDARDGRQTQTTSLPTNLRDAYARVRSVVKDIAGDFGAELENIGGKVCPSEVEMEFSLAVSAEGKVVWLVTGKGEFGLKVNITWDLSTNDQGTKTINR